MKIEVKKYKQFKALMHEGSPFTAQLWADGQHVADIEYDANGGPYNYYPTNHPAFAKVKEWVKAQPDYQSVYGPLTPNLDLYVGDAIESFQRQKKIASYKKKGQVCFVKAGEQEKFDKGGSFFVSKAGVSLDAITKAYPGCIIL